MNELKKRRKKLEITQLQAANACGVSLRTYQTYEETINLNSTYDELIKKLDDIGVLDGSNYIASVRSIKHVCRELFKTKYPLIKCAYLYGSYSRGEANGKSEINIAIVADKLNNELINEISSELEKKLHKRVDLRTYNQLKKDTNIIEDILISGIKII